MAEEEEETADVDDDPHSEAIRKAMELLSHLQTLAQSGLSEVSIDAATLADYVEQQSNQERDLAQRLVQAKMELAEARESVDGLQVQLNRVRRQQRSAPPIVPPPSPTATAEQGDARGNGPLQNGGDTSAEARLTALRLAKISLGVKVDERRRQFHELQRDTERLQSALRDIEGDW